MHQPGQCEKTVVVCGLTGLTGSANLPAFWQNSSPASAWWLICAGNGMALQQKSPTIFCEISGILLI